MIHTRIRFPLSRLGVAILLLVVTACGSAENATSPFAPIAAPATNTAAPPTNTPEPVETVDPAFEAASVFAGKWQGEWHNLTFDTRGDVTMTVVIEEGGVASITIDLGGMVFGQIDPDPATYPGTYDAAGATFMVEGDPIFGTLQVTVGADGSVQITSENSPIPGIQGLTAQGTITADTLQLEYEITASFGTANGEMNLTKTP